MKTTDELLDIAESHYARYESLPRWRWLRRRTFLNAFLVIMVEVQRRELEQVKTRMRSVGRVNFGASRRSA